MDIPFATIEKYADHRIRVQTTTGASMGGDQPMQWEPAEDAPTWIADAVATLFSARGDQMETVLRLNYPDISGLGNSLYRLVGKEHQFCLKLLGDQAGNDREIIVWEILGYGEANKQEGQPFQAVKGLPPRKFTIVEPGLRTILTPYYEGVLKAIPGGCYEFPLVLCVVGYLAETLNQLHRRGLVYMDVCPSNILFKTTPGDFLLFFLTDMGGVKPLDTHPQDDPYFQRLKDIMVPRRWTRREALPPTHLFAPNEADPRLECHPEYDYYTLARTAMVLLGLGPDSPADSPILESFGQELQLEDPLRPTREEMACFLELLKPWLSGQPLQTEALAQHKQSVKNLYRDFFLKRSAFAGRFLDHPIIKESWVNLVRARARRYKMALSLQEYDQLCSQMEADFGVNPEAGITGELAHFRGLPQALIAKDPSTSLRLLRHMAESKLVRNCQTCNYSFSYHKKLVRALWSRDPEFRRELAEIGADLPRSQTLEEEPETATNRSLRRGNDTELGILTRQVDLGDGLVTEPRHEG